MLAGACVVGMSLLPAVWADGIELAKPSMLRKLVPASALEQEASQQYAALKQQALRQGALAPDQHPQLRRLRTIARRMIPLVTRYNPQAADWAWEINLIGSREINAFCMPGGKIAFYSGLLDSLQLSDDEVAMVMGRMDLAARAGFDPRAGISLWQKMTAASRGAPPQWLSTHPSGSHRIHEIESHLPQVMPLYEQARARP